MATNGNNKRDRAAWELARGRSIKAAAENAEVGERTLHRWLKEDPDFALRVSELRTEIWDQTVGRLVSLGDKCADTLEKLLESTNELAALAACRTILSEAVNLREKVEIARRVEALERRLKVNERNPK